MTDLVVYDYPDCGGSVSEPWAFGRSWCNICEEIVVPLVTHYDPAGPVGHLRHDA